MKNLKMAEARDMYGEVISEHLSEAMIYQADQHLNLLIELI
ncbi:hypothetical protein ACFSJY_06345 [Thalassotalea euphylliae]